MSMEMKRILVTLGLVVSLILSVLGLKIIDFTVFNHVIAMILEAFLTAIALACAFWLMYIIGWFIFRP